MKLIKNNYVAIILVVGILFGFYEGLRHDAMTRDKLYNQYVECSSKPITSDQFMMLELKDKLYMINQNCNFKNKQEYSDGY